MKFPLLVFAFIIPFLTTARELEDKNVLVVHSYHQGLEWTDNISQGINQVFYDHPEYQLFYEYLDTKRNNSPDYMEQLAGLFEMKMAGMQFSAIIASDNAAYQFISKYAENLFKNIPIIYCGINNAEKIVTDLPHNNYVLGEDADHYGTLSIASALLTEVDTMLVINDNTLTGRSIRTELESILPQFEDRFVFQFLSEFTIEELESKVSKLNKHTGIYLLVVNQDSNGEFISYRKGINAVKRSANVPILGSWDFYLGKGILGGKITSGIAQGESAARLVIGVLTNNDDARDRVRYVDNRCQLDYREIQRFGIDLDQMNEAYDLIFAPAEKSYQKHFYILLGISLFAMQVVIYIFYIKKKTSKKLVYLVDEKTKELQEIIEKKNQLLSIIAHDLRTPIGNMMEINKMIIDKSNDLSLVKRDVLQKEAFKTSANVFALLEDLLVWGRFQFVKTFDINRSKIMLYPLLKEVEALYQYIKSDSRINIMIDESLVLFTDEFILKFAIRNLIQNAYKFSQENSTIDIGAAWDENDAIIWVKDYGIGMSDEVIESINSYCPIQKRGTKGQQSFGLGLTSVIQLLECENSTLTIESEVGKGSTFTIRLKDAKS